MGRDYYIDTDGNDGNDGLTPETPLETFFLINKTPLNPGDRVLLKRGCIFNEMLTITGQGTADYFIEISSYGTGEKPCIKRNGEIGDRCIRINNASYLKLNSLECCNGGAGIVLFYDNSCHNRSVYLEDIKAHDFYGIYRASGSSSKNPAWQNYVAEDRVGFSLGICVTGKDTAENKDERVLSDFIVKNCEIYKTGGGIGLDWCDHRNSDGSITGCNKFGEVVFDHLYLHDNDVPDVSLTSMFLQCVTNAVFTNSVIDNGAGGAPWGTAAVHLQLARNVRIENVTIKNMPHTGVSDECGIDFETEVHGCIIRNCTFENNAGAAIEFLSNFEMSPLAVSQDVLIEQCRFINNNWAKLYTNPSQVLIHLWQHDNCPTGILRDCVCQNPEGVNLLGGDGGLHMFVQQNNEEI